MKMVKGIIGGLIGGILASVPWILLYVYGNMIYSLLAAIIAMGVNFGYRKLGGEVDKKLPTIITVLSLVSIVFVTLVIIPLLLLAKEGWAMSIPNLKFLYENTEFTAAIFKDLAWAILFTFMGIAGIVRKIKMEVSGEDASKYKSPYEAALEAQKDLIAKVKAIFKKKKAMDKESAVGIDELSEITSEPELKRIFNTLKIQQIVRKKSGKYYFSEKSETSAGTRFILLFSKIMVIMLIIVLIGLLLTVL